MVIFITFFRNEKNTQYNFKIRFPFNRAREIDNNENEGDEAEK